MSADVETHVRWPEPQGRAVPTPSEFAERNGLIPELTPFAHLRFEPWELVDEVASAFRDMPETAALPTLDQIVTETHKKSNRWRASCRAALLLAGSWPFDTDSGINGRWVNPHYLHERALAPVDADRTEHALTCADLGVLEQDDVAPRFDITPGRFRKWVHYHNIAWAERRGAARKRLARTLAATVEWTDWYLTDLAEFFPFSYDGVRKWLRVHVKGANWEVPDDPSMTGRFE